MACWLMKSEPHVYSWDDLVRDRATDWDGVRNNAARLHLRAMQPGDEAFFYHSGDEKQVVGIMTRHRPGQARRRGRRLGEGPGRPGPSAGAGDAEGDQGGAEASAKMELVRQSRLSVSPVRDEEWRTIISLSG